MAKLANQKINNFLIASLLSYKTSLKFKDASFFPDH